MKRLLLLLTIAACGAAALLTLPSKPKSRGALPGERVACDPVEVFQRAFWQRPRADDRILHSERREWRDDGGILHTQWFLAVRPSPGLTRYLREENAFGLIPAGKGQPPVAVPDWFSCDASEVMRSPDGRMSLHFAGDMLYAAGSASSARPGAPVPTRPSDSSVTQSGRLPAASPPSS